MGAFSLEFHRCYVLRRNPQQINKSMDFQRVELDESVGSVILIGIAICSASKIDFGADWSGHRTQSRFLALRMSPQGHFFVKNDVFSQT